MTKREGNGLYSVREIGVMTDAGLDELLSHYQDTGNTEGMRRVTDELDSREDDRQARAELEYELEQERLQAQHDEMIASSPAVWDSISFWS